MQVLICLFFFQAEDGIRDIGVTGVQTCALPIFVSAVAGRITEPGSGLELSASQVGLGGAIYIAGAVTGALIFGYLTDRYGRKKLFLITLALYLAATTFTAFAMSAWWFYRSEEHTSELQS